MDSTFSYAVSYEIWAPPELMTPSRLLLAWSILRLRHPLIGSRISHLSPQPPLSSNPLSKSSSPFSSAKKAELDAYYCSAAFVLDPPSSPEAALEQSWSTLDARVTENDKMKSEDLLWDFYNGPRILSAEKVVVLTVVKSDTQGQDEAITASAATSASNRQSHPSQSRTRASGIKREQYIMHVALLHCAIDGLATFTIYDELLQLIGASSAVPSTSSPSLRRHNQAAAAKRPIDPASHVPRTEAQLRALLRAEWALRYGPASPLRQTRKGEWNGFAFMPASFEARLPPFTDRKAAINDFEQDQAKYEGGHALLRQSPANPLSHSSTAAPSSSDHDDFRNQLSTRERVQAQPITPNRHNVTRDLVFPPDETRRILRRCKAEGVSVQNAMFAVANVAWLRMLDRARRAIQSGDQQKTATTDAGFNAMKAWAEKCGGPTLMYSAANLRPLVGDHEHESRIPEAFRASAQTQAAWRRQDIVVGSGAASGGSAGTSLLPSDSVYVALGYFNVQLPDGAKRRHDAAAMSDFWARARDAKRQTSEAVSSSHMISRNVLMGEERGARSVRFAMEDDGYVPRPSWVAGPPTPAAASTPVASSSSSQPPKPAPTPAPVIKAAPAAALLGLSLMGSVDTTWSYHLYPTITPTLCRCGTRKAYGGSLVFVYTFRGTLCVGYGWDEKAFPEFDVVLPDGEGAGGVGMRALYQEMRDVVADFMLDGPGSGTGVEAARGLDLSGRTRLPEWSSDHYAVPLLPKQEKENVKVVRHGAGTRPATMVLAKL
ncbi:hypothetical protein DL93DRAFT_2165762 [Clavulina sp. PMI_390]|nr:hypothetical protein DL93DRAFT_2165762 [Clavulina sp. PMI_390]